MSRASLFYTLEFVRSKLKPGAQRILEIGCGDGELAALLVAEGHEVIAIDKDPDAVERARLNGVDARFADWPQALAERSFDSVLFTRSLHHIHDLERAVGAARQALRPNGAIIVEDHRTEGGTARSSLWYVGLCDLLVATGALAADAEELHGKIAIEGERRLHSSDEIGGALARNFETVERSAAAYYFRYLEPGLAKPDASELLLRHERDLIATDAIDALGVRFVAR